MGFNSLKDVLQEQLEDLHSAETQLIARYRRWRWRRITSRFARPSSIISRRRAGT